MKKFGLRLVSGLMAVCCSVNVFATRSVAYAEGEVLDREIAVEQLRDLEEGIELDNAYGDDQVTRFLSPEKNRMRIAANASQRAYNLNNPGKKSSKQEVRRLVEEEERNIVQRKVFKNKVSIAGQVELRSNDTIVVSFHGSEDKNDALTDIFATKRKDTTFGTGGYLHRGFYDRYMESRSGMLYCLASIVAENKLSYEDIEIIVTGHSLGGALASIAAVDLKNMYQNDTKIYGITFCSPRVFDHTAAREVKKKFGERDFLRIWRQSDIVSMVSLGTGLLGRFSWITGYKHVGKSCKIKTFEKNGKKGGVLDQHSISNMLLDIYSDGTKIDTHHVGFWDRIVNKFRSK